MVNLEKQLSKNVLDLINTDTQMRLITIEYDKYVTHMETLGNDYSRITYNKTLSAYLKYKYRDFK